MLSNELLKQLNDNMLSLGEPVERDFSGYNIPDFAICYNLAYIPSEEYTPVYSYALVDRLLHYKNTQMSFYAEELLETKKALEKELDEYETENYKTIIKDANFLYKPQDDKKKIYFVDYHEDTGFVEMHHDSFSKKEKDFKETHYPKVKNVNRGDAIPYWNVMVSLELLQDYVDYMKKTFSFDVNLINFLKNTQKIENDIKDLQERQKQAEIEAKKVKMVKQVKDGLQLHFEGYVPELKPFVDMHREDGVKWKKVDNKFDIIVPPHLYIALKQLLPDYDFSGVSYSEEKAKELQEIEDAKTRNDNELIDYTKTDLPFTPYPYQIEDATKALTKKRFLLGQDMGCGKTLISILVGESIPTKKLVICPASLRLNWRKEIFNVRKDADVKILYSKDEISNFEFGEYTIVGYKTISKYKDEILAANLQCVFIDEVHNCKAVSNMGKPTSKQAEAVVSIATKAEYCYLLTGTPIPTRTKDLFNVLRMLGVPKYQREKDFFKFGLRYCDGYNNGFGWNFTGNSHGEELHKTLQNYMIRRLKKDVLPNLTKQRVFIPMETHSRDYKKIEKRLYEPEDKDTMMGLAMSGRKVLSKDKVEIAIDLANSFLEEGRSVVIVSNFNDTLDKIMDTYKNECCCIRGGMKDEAKQKAIDDFQSGAKKVCALNIIAGGVGVTLTKASDMIIVDYDWTPSNMSQVEDRICRSGQTKECTIHYIYCENSVFDNIFVDMITNKSANSDLIIDGSENTMDLKSGVSDTFENRLKIFVKETKPEPKQTKNKKSNDINDTDDKDILDDDFLPSDDFFEIG